MKFLQSEPDYESGSKSRIKISKRIFVDINTQCECDCLIFLDSETDTSYSYYTKVNILSSQIIESSILDDEVLKLCSEYNSDLTKLLQFQADIKGEIPWN